MSCRNCPYNESQYEFVDEEYIWCDKVGGKLIYSGYCCDAYDEVIVPDKTSRRKRSNKRDRREKYQRHLKNISVDRINHYPPAAWNVDRIWISGYGFFKLPKSYYKRFYRSKYSSYLKRQAAKKVRRNREELYKGHTYRKVFNFWNEYC